MRGRRPHIRERQMKIGLAGRERDRPFESLGGFIKSSQHLQCNAARVVQPRQFGADGKPGFITRRGLRGPIERQRGVAEIAVRFGKIQTDRWRKFVVHNRLIEAIAGAEQGAEIVVGLGQRRELMASARRQCAMASW